MSILNKNENGSSGLSLAVRLQEGSREAWAELVELYEPLVASWAARSGLDETRSHDVAQEVFLAVHRSISRFNPTQPHATFRGWLWRITRNVILRLLRTREPAAQGGSTARAALAAVPDPWLDCSEDEPPSSSHDTTALVRRALAQIKPQVAPQTWQAF